MQTYVGPDGEHAVLYVDNVLLPVMACVLAIFSRQTITFSIVPDVQPEHWKRSYLIATLAQTVLLTYDGPDGRHPGVPH